MSTFYRKVMQLYSFFQILFHLLTELFVTGTYSYSLLANNSMVEVNKFLESFFTRSNSTTIQEWESNLPTQKEKDEMRELVSFIYQLTTFDSLHDSLMDGYSSLKNYVTISVVQGHFCVIHELIANETHRFPRMWGYTVIASKLWYQRPIHHSAAHFESDGEVCSQAAALLESTKSRSLVVAGASRYAVIGNHRSDCQPQFQLADAAHNCRSMFHWVNTVLKDLADEEAQKEGKENGHFFVQWHGMAETSCIASDVFISAGIANSSIYDVDIPAIQMLKSFNRLAAGLGMRASCPRQDRRCRLIAGTNVFGRYVNGVERDKVCHTPAEPKQVVGRFVHVEQKMASRQNIALWTSVIQDAFSATSISSRSWTVIFVTIFFSSVYF